MGRKVPLIPNAAVSLDAVAWWVKLLSWAIDKAAGKKGPFAAKR